MGKLPAIQFYPGDWLRDPVAGCSLQAQGLWLRMMFLMHDSDRYGYLSCNGVAIPSEAITRRCSCDSLRQYTTLLAELSAAGVPSKTTDGIIFSRRMVKDAKDRAANAGRQAAHRKDKAESNDDVTGDVTDLSQHSSASASASDSKEGEGKRPPASKGFPAAIDDALQQCSLDAIPKEFVMQCFDKALSRGGKDARQVPIENFPAYCRTEHKYERERLEKEKNTNKPGSPGVSTADKILKSQEYDRITKRMAMIRGQYSDMQTWTAGDIAEFNKLKVKKLELKKLLGLTL